MILVWWGHFLGQGISIQTRNGRRQRIIFAGMRHTAVCETLIFSIDKKETTSTKKKRILIENKSNSSLEDPVWRTVRYIWLLQILTALRVSENFWMWCQKKGWLHQSTVVSKTCKKPSKRFCEITSQTSHNSVLPKRLLSCGVRSVYHHPPPRFCSLYPQQQRYHPVPRCPQVQRWPFRAMFLPSGCPWRFQWILNLLPGVYEAKNQKKLLLLHNSV